LRLRARFVRIFVGFAPISASVTLRRDSATAALVAHFEITEVIEVIDATAAHIDSHRAHPAAHRTRRART
jgi:hypothetical protein